MNAALRPGSLGTTRYFAAEPRVCPGRCRLPVARNSTVEAPR